jgi:hypothetical protein
LAILAALRRLRRRYVRIEAQAHMCEGPYL